jgi:hypothetical protein
MVLYNVMKRITKCESKHCTRRLVLSLLCAGVAATFIAGCAEAPYMTTAYDQGYYYPSGSYWRDYDGYYQAYPFSETPSGPRYRIVDGMRVYEPYYYGASSYTAPTSPPGY